jgi:type II secretory pathway predicted ATPase ExeA
MLSRQFKKELRVVLLDRGPQETRRGLLQAILHELGQPFRGMDESELRLALADYLTIADDCPNGILLVVDEAHGYPLRVLDEMRSLTNVAAAGQPRVRLVLVGSGALEERLASPKLDSFGQRIVARCYLESLNRSETHDYIHDHLRRVGTSAESLFPSEACYSVHRATDGVPRLINQLCDHALLLAYANEERGIKVERVEEAWADLQQLPTPWNGEKPASSGQKADVIEFGSLDGDDDHAPAEHPEPATPILRVTADDDLSSLESAEPIEPAEQIEQIESTLASLDDDFEPAGSIGPEVELVFSDPSNPFSEHFAEEEDVVDRYGEEPQSQPHPAIESGTVEACCSSEHEESSAVTIDPEEVGVWPMPLDNSETTTAEAADNSDLITIEDHYDDIQVTAARPVAPVKPQEYRRLFARLRHG